MNVKPLTTTQDFEELLNLSTIATQIEVLDFLNKNMKLWTKNFLQSNIVSIDEAISKVPEADLKNWTAHCYRYHWIGAEKQHFVKPATTFSWNSGTHHFNDTAFELNKKLGNLEGLSPKEKCWLFFPKKKRIVHMNDVKLKDLKLILDKTGKLVAKFNNSYEMFSEAHYRIRYWLDGEHSLEIQFNVGDMTIETVKSKLSVNTEQKHRTW